MENNKVKIIFIGTPEFGAVVLEKLIKGGYPPILVVTAPDKPVGRKQILTPPPVKLVAQEYNILVSQPPNINNSSGVYLLIRQKEPDIIVMAAYGQIIPKQILEIPKYGCLNVHPSLLPRWRGPSPVQYTILNGDEETGVTIMKITEKVDAGPIISNSKLQITNPKITYKELHNKLVEMGAELLLETIPKWIRGEIKPQPQNESKATYTKILTKEDGKIDWRKSAEVLERQIRAFYSWPGSYAIFDNRTKSAKIKVLKARIYKSPDGSKYPLGKVLVVPQNEIGVQCGKDFLVIERLQMEGKKEIEADDFLRGHPDFIGIILK